MTRLLPADDEFPFARKEIKFPDFEISWVGECPWRDGLLCFGSDDGRLRFTSRDNPTEYLYTAIMADSGEAINGVAFSNQFLVVTTRSEVVVWTVPFENEGKKVYRAVYDGGAHGVTVTHPFKFVAPIGVGGLLHIEPNFDPEDQQLLPVTTSGAPVKTFNFYRAITLGTSKDGGPVLACAVRRDGLISTNLSPFGEANFRSISVPNLDVVDICSFKSAERPRSLVALGKDGSLLLTADVLNDKRPLILRFDRLEGMGYKVLTYKNDVFLLTSEHLYFLSGLPSQFLDGKLADRPMMSRGIKLQAVDAFLVYERLMVVMPDRTIWVDLASFNSRHESRPHPVMLSHEFQAFDLKSEITSHPWGAPHIEPLFFSNFA